MCVVNQKSKSSNFPCNLSTFSNQLCPQCPLRLFKSQLPRICLPIIAFNQGYIQASSPLPIATTNRLQSMTTLLFTQLPTTASISSNQYQIMQNLRAAREGDTSLCLSLRGQPRVRGLFRSCWCWFAAGCVWPAGGQLGCARVISIFLGQISLGASILTFNNYKNRSCSLHSFIWWNRGAKRTISPMAEQVSTFLDQQFLFVLDWRYYLLRVVSLQNNHNRLLYNSCSPKERPIASRGNNVPNKFYYYIQSMAEPEQKVSIKQDVSEQLSQNYEYRDQQLNAYEDDHECELDLEQKYFQKLKQQRKRIEELSLLHQSYEERLEREGERNRGLREEIEKLAGYKEYHARYSESVASLQLLAQENRSLKEHNEDLKQQNYQSTIDKANLVQKLRLEVSLLRDKESAKVQSLEEELYAKQEELDRLAREFKAKEKEYQEGLSGLRAKMAALDNEKHEQLRIQQRKVEKLEKELAYRSESYSESQSNTDSLLKESSRQKEDNYRLNSLLASREIEFKSLGEKYRRHMAGCRKDAANRDKECQELKETLRKYEKEAKDCASESEILRAEVRKVKETLQLERGRWVSDFSKEKSALQATILQHSRTIEELLEIKNGLMADKAKLQSILKKKTDCENKRLSFLKSEWKEINKLEKVIDKIIE